MKKVKFLIVSCKRTGTHMVGDVLKRLDNVYFVSEHFNCLWNYPVYRASSKKMMDELYGHLSEDGIEACGTTLHVGQEIYEYQKCIDIWEYLRTQDDIRFIHVWRRNVVEQAISQIFADATGIWSIPAGMKPEIASRTIPIYDLFFHIRRISGATAMLREYFKDKTYLELCYEDMTTDWPATLRKVQEFLELPVQPLSQASGKILRKPLPELVENYEQIYQVLKDTQFKDFLDKDYIPKNIMVLPPKAAVPSNVPLEPVKPAELRR
jgi:hypothetical protein